MNWVRRRKHSPNGTTEFLASFTASFHLEGVIYLGCNTCYTHVTDTSRKPGSWSVGIAYPPLFGKPRKLVGFKFTQPPNSSNVFSQGSIKKHLCSTSLTSNAKCTDEFGVCLTHGIGGYSVGYIVNISDK